MYCIYCGALLPDNARFCLNCGQPQFNRPATQENKTVFSYQNLVSYEYDSIEEIEHRNYTQKTDLTQYYILFRKNNKYGISDCNFSVVYLPCEFDSIEVYTTNSEYNKPFFKTRKGSTIGLYEGSRLIMESDTVDILAHNIDYPPRFFFVRAQNGKYGIKFLSTSSKLAKYCQPVYDQVKEYTCDTVKVKQNGKWGMINTFGSEIPILFDDINFVHQKDLWRMDNLSLKLNGREILLPYTRKEIDGKTYSGYESKEFGFFYMTYIS